MGVELNLAGAVLQAAVQWAVAAAVGTDGRAHESGRLAGRGVGLRNLYPPYASSVFSAPQCRSTLFLSTHTQEVSIVAKGSSLPTTHQDATNASHSFPLTNSR